MCLSHGISWGAGGWVISTDEEVDAVGFDVMGFPWGAGWG